MSAGDAVKRLAELVSLLCSEFRKVNAENNRLREELAALKEKIDTSSGRSPSHLKLVENTGGSLQEREQIIAKLEEMLDELEEIV